jgi:cyanate permease
MDPRRRAYGLVLVGTLAYLLLTFVWFSLPAYLTTIIEDVGLTGTEAGLLVGAVPLTYIPLALFSGLAVDRLGPGRSLAVGVAIYGTAQIGRSAAPGFPSLFAFTVLLGVGATAITFGLPKLVSVLFPPAETGLPSSLYLVGSSLGSVLVFAVGRPVIGPALGGWRPLFLWSGVAALAYAAVWAAIAWRAAVDAAVTETDASFSLASVRSDLELVLSNRQLQLVVVVGTMYLLLNHGLQGWLPTLLESRGLSPNRAGQTTSLFVAALAVGIFTVPPLADRVAARRGAVAVCGCCISVGVVGVVVGGLGALLVAGIVVTGIGAGGLSPLIRAIPTELEGIGTERTGAAVGFIFAVGEIGGFLGPVAVGTLRDLTASFLPGLAVLAAAGLVVVVAGETLRRATG